MPTLTQTILIGPTFLLQILPMLEMEHIRSLLLEDAGAIDTSSSFPQD
jgi:hypothetical protein